MKTARFLFSVLLLIIATVQLSANDIAVSNVITTGKNTSGVQTDHYILVQFDIAWANSWRTSTGPSNWDAAWIFIKYRKEGVTSTWNHATLNSTGHNAPTGSTITLPTDGKGAFIYRDADGSGTFSKSGVRLRWNYGANGIQDNDDFEINLMAIEMVYVPGGSYIVGNSSGGTSPLPVTTITTATANAAGGYPAGYQPTVTTYPNGFNSYYCMKYEITQEQYMVFLNSLTYDQQTGRTAIGTSISSSSSIGYGALTNSSAVSGRNGIEMEFNGVSNTTPAVFGCNFNDNTSWDEIEDGQFVACNYLSWDDVAAYLDWAALRPMTELEFEKSCRGRAANLASEYAWGTTAIAGSAYTITNTGGATEYIYTNYSLNSGNASYTTTTSAMSGPLRAGIYAAATQNTGRISSGAGYYGVMELSGNVAERTITIGTTAGKAYTGEHGDGVLTTSSPYGCANTTAWPGIGGGTGPGYRGGSWSSAATTLYTSDRSTAQTTSVTRTAAIGGRGVRTMP